MRANHLFENAIYILSNHAVARNPIFSNKAYCERFLQKVDKYIGPVCEIMQYSLDQNQFHIMVKLKSRAVFCAYYRKKKNDESLPEEKIPHETYIFSQAMANLQSSAAIHFNRIEQRTGALFARRYYKHLVESEAELEQWVERLKEFSHHIQYTAKWLAREITKVRRRWVKRNSVKSERNGALYYKYKKAIHPILRSFMRIRDMELQGHFELLPLKSIKGPFSMISHAKKLRPPS